MRNDIVSKGRNPSHLQNHKCNLRLLVRIVLYSLLGIWVLVYNPFGISDRTDEINQQVVYRLISKLYPSTKARDNIVIVLLTQQGITNLYHHGLFRANIWPIQYRDHAFILSRIMKKAPHAIFLDIYFDQERAIDDSLDMSIKRLKHSMEKTQTRVFFASGFSISDLTPVQQALASIDAQPVITGWESLGELYPLKASDSKNYVCKNKPCQRLSAALALYKSYCRDGPGAGCNKNDLLDPIKVPVYDRNDSTQSEGLSVYWGNKPANISFALDTLGQCEQGSSSILKKIKGFIGDLILALFGEDTTRPLVSCAYHQFITADYLVSIMRNGTDAEKKELDKLLRGKLILYSLKLEGVDTVISPVHGQLPGVFMHAMALDNLMTFGSEYIRGEGEYTKFLSVMIWIGLVIFYALGMRKLERSSVVNGELNSARWQTGQQKNFYVSFLRKNSRKQFNVFRNHPKSVMLILVVLLMVIIVFSMFYYLRLEPVNSFAFIGLFAIISYMNNSKFELWIFNRFGLDLQSYSEESNDSPETSNESDS